MTAADYAIGVGVINLLALVLHHFFPKSPVTAAVDTVQAEVAVLAPAAAVVTAK